MRPPFFLSLFLSFSYSSLFLPSSNISPFFSFTFSYFLFLLEYLVLSTLLHVFLGYSFCTSSFDAHFHVNSRFRRFLFFDFRSLTRTTVLFATIPIIRCARTTTPSIMAMTAARLSLCHLYRQRRVAFASLVCCSAAARPNFPAVFLTFHRSYFRDVRRMLAQALSDLR